MIIDHPLENKFSLLHHPSYYDFFNDLLPQTRDPHQLEHRFEKSYAENSRYIDLYRNSYAYHGVHPFYMWYWGAHGMAHMGKVIVVRPKSRLAAPSMDAAIGMARDFAGRDASLCYFHCPPIIMATLPA
jgi:hypothetical protein